MSKTNIDTLRLLYSSYSPLMTNNQLLKQYQLVTNKYITDDSQIRDIYNKEITSGFMNEAVIKYAFIKKYGLNKSPANTVTIFELNTGSSRADICMLNGKSMVFEIKTEYDTFARLDSQLSDYKKAFEFINLIVPIAKADDARAIVDDNIGIITYKQSRNKTIIFNIYREPNHNNEMNPLFQLNQFTKKQLNLLVNNVNLSKKEMIEHLFITKPKDHINRCYIDLMKNKYQQKWDFLIQNKTKIKPLDYQWFFKNNISTETVYK